MQPFKSALLAASLAFTVGSAQAQAPAGYPAKTVSVVVPFAPGGGSDNIARLVVGRLAERTKATFIVENKPGGGTNIGNDYVSRAAADGHTLLFGQVTLAINPHVYKSLRYDVEKSFVPVAHFANTPTVLVVPPSLPVKTVQEFIDYAKKNPGAVNYGSGGKGTSVHLAGELFASLTGVNMLHIPYKGSAPAMADLIGGRIHAMFDTAPSALSHIRGGNVRALAVTGTERLAELPDVPTFAEAGLASFNAPAWYGLLAPAGTPAPVVRYLNAEVEQVLKDPEIRQRLAQLGAQAVGGNPDTFAAFIQTESKRWGEVIRKADISLD